MREERTVGSCERLRDEIVVGSERGRVGRDGRQTSQGIKAMWTRKQQLRDSGFKDSGLTFSPKNALPLQVARLSTAPTPSLQRTHLRDANILFSCTQPFSVLPRTVPTLPLEGTEGGNSSVAAVNLSKLILLLMHCMSWEIQKLSKLSTLLISMCNWNKNYQYTYIHRLPSFFSHHLMMGWSSCSLGQYLLLGTKIQVSGGRCQTTPSTACMQQDHSLWGRA